MMQYKNETTAVDDWQKTVEDTTKKQADQVTVAT